MVIAAIREVERPTLKPIQLLKELRQLGPHQTQRFAARSLRPDCQPPVPWWFISPLAWTMRAPGGASRKSIACEYAGAVPAPPELRAIMPSPFTPPGHRTYAAA
jgi:hypothetical protein